MLPSFAHLSVCSKPADERFVDFVTTNGHVVVSLHCRSQGQMALVGVRGGGILQMSAPLEDFAGLARVEYEGQTGVCTAPKGAVYTRLFLRSAHNRGLTRVLVRGGYMIGRFKKL